MELRKNIYQATSELPVEIIAKGKTLFYITDQLSTHKEVSTVNVSTHQPPRPQVNGSPPQVPVPKTTEKAKNVMEIMKKTAKAPMFCPKHDGMRVGLTYSCGCSV